MMLFAFLPLFLSFPASFAESIDKDQYVPFLLKNVDAKTGLPHSYYVPEGWYDAVPEKERPQSAKKSQVVIQCDSKEVPNNLQAQFYVVAYFVNMLRLLLTCCCCCL